jgi:hypothetical protein
VIWICAGLDRHARNGVVEAVAFEAAFTEEEPQPVNDSLNLFHPSAQDERSSTGELCASSPSPRSCLLPEGCRISGPADRAAGHGRCRDRLRDKVLALGFPVAEFQLRGIVASAF